ncbi:hypothetical protein CARUB_v10003380mg [Capsella rubella]|uniref:Uncharacterized protein n=1 Tax=Capsella rubella TaxID=81985 RepID=R0FL31_9BRAS|nr:hypothetical protein CARUB_v10003380mg [Capsella rubella]
MTAFIALFTGLCCFKQKKNLPIGTVQTGRQSSPLETTTREQTSNDLEHKESDDLQHKEADDRDTNASKDGNSIANADLPLPPARKEALRETYSCNNMMLRKSMSTRKKLSASLTIQMPRSLSMALKRDGLEDKSVKEKKPKAENSILVRPIILGERCKVLDEGEGDDDHNQRMPKNRIYRPRSMSSISISRSNSKIDMNVNPIEVTSEDSMKSKENTC